MIFKPNFYNVIDVIDFMATCDNILKNSCASKLFAVAHHEPPLAKKMGKLHKYFMLAWFEDNKHERKLRPKCYIYLAPRSGRGKQQNAINYVTLASRSTDTKIFNIRNSAVSFAQQFEG